MDHGQEMEDHRIVGRDARRRDITTNETVGRKSDYRLYRCKHETYDEGDKYDSSTALGFIQGPRVEQTAQAKHQFMCRPGGRPLDCPASFRRRGPDCPIRQRPVEYQTGDSGSSA